MRVIAVACVVLVAALTARVDDAQACSCIPPDPKSMLLRAYGAFVGALVSRRDLANGRSLFNFAVEQPVKGAIGNTIEVESASNGGACGLETQVGRRIGLFVDRDRDVWKSTLCWQVDGDDLLAVARPNVGRPALLVGGRFGSARVLGLDRAGGILARGAGPGTTTHLSTCPGGQRIAEIVALGPGYRVAIREATTLRLIREQTLRLPGRRRPVELHCENHTGTSVLVFARWWCCDGPNNAAVYRLKRGLTALWNGDAYTATFDRGRAFLCGPTPRGLDALHILTLGSGRITTRVPFDGACARFVLDPTRSRVAGISYGITGPTHVTLVEFGGRSPTVRQLLLSNDIQVYGDVKWVSRTRFVFLPWYGNGKARFLDLGLRTHARFRWIAGSATLVDSTVFGIHENGTLRAARLPSGPMRVLRSLPGTPEVIVAAG